MKDFGVLVPIVTPCSRAGAIDAAGVAAVCADMLDAGCTGIFVASSTGRGPWFSRADRVAVCRAAVAAARDKAPVFAGCMATGLPEMLENACAFADAGARFAVITPPPYYKYSQTEIERIFLKFADCSPLPVMLYDIPVLAGMKLSVEPVVKLARHPNVVAFKDSSADFDRFKEVLSALADLPDFWIFQGKEHLLSDSLRIGASGFIVSLTHMSPALFVRLYRAVRAGDPCAAALQDRVTRIFNLVEGSFPLREGTSTLYHILNGVVTRRGVCANILLDHEGDTPASLRSRVDQIMKIAQEPLPPEDA
ncbi:MAG: dihydrodipicolinate synthase family protein [Planctomycetota bacterium]